MTRKKRGFRLIEDRTGATHVATYIRFVHTTDGASSGEIDWYVDWEPVSDDGFFSTIHTIRGNMKYLILLLIPIMCFGQMIVAVNTYICEPDRTVLRGPMGTETIYAYIGMQGYVTPDERVAPALQYRKQVELFTYETIDDAVTYWEEKITGHLTDGETLEYYLHDGVYTEEVAGVEGAELIAEWIVGRLIENPVGEVFNSDGDKIYQYPWED